MRNQANDLIDDRGVLQAGSQVHFDQKDDDLPPESPQGFQHGDSPLTLTHHYSERNLEPRVRLPFDCLEVVMQLSPVYCF